MLGFGRTLLMLWSCSVVLRLSKETSPTRVCWISDCSQLYFRIQSIKRLGSTSLH